MTTNTYLCVDLKTITRDGMKENKAVRGSLVMTEDGERFAFFQGAATSHIERPELHWRLLDRTKHGRATINSRHVKVEFYIHHDEYQDGADLADILAREVETLGEQFCETNFKEEVSKCC